MSLPFPWLCQTSREGSCIPGQRCSSSHAHVLSSEWWQWQSRAQASMGW